MDGIARDSTATTFKMLAGLIFNVCDAMCIAYTLRLFLLSNTLHACLTDYLSASVPGSPDPIGYLPPRSFDGILEYYFRFPGSMYQRAFYLPLCAQARMQNWRPPPKQAFHKDPDDGIASTLLQSSQTILFSTDL